MNPRRPGRSSVLVLFARMSGHCFAALVLCTVVGCGHEPPTAVVTGTVTFKGEPLPMATIMFFHDKDIVGNGPIRDGAYRLERVPTGPVGIAIVSIESSKSRTIPTGMPAHRQRMYEKAQELGYASSEPAKKSDGKQDTPKSVRIPTKYNSAQNSGLTLNVVAGQQNHDIELQP